MAPLTTTPTATATTVQEECSGWVYYISRVENTVISGLNETASIGDSAILFNILSTIKLLGIRDERPIAKDA